MSVHEDEGDADDDEEEEEIPAFVIQKKPPDVSIHITGETVKKKAATITQRRQTNPIATTTTTSATHTSAKRQKSVLIPKPVASWKLWSVILLLVAWSFALTVFVLYIKVSYTTAVAAPPPPPVIIQASNKRLNAPTKFIHTFNLVASSAQNEGLLWVNLSVPNLNYDRIVRYDICCHNHQKRAFACRSVTRNLGVDGYVLAPSTVMIQILHPDMVGSSCAFIWAESNK